MTLLISNKHAHRNYFIVETLECGMELKGTEVKSISRANCSINEAYIQIKDLEAFIINMHIAPFLKAINLIMILTVVVNYYFIKRNY